MRHRGADVRVTSGGKTAFQAEGTGTAMRGLYMFQTLQAVHRARVGNGTWNGGLGQGHERSWFLVILLPKVTLCVSQWDQTLPSISTSVHLFTNPVPTFPS